jgi:hypothetical protein
MVNKGSFSPRGAEPDFETIFDEGEDPSLAVVRAVAAFRGVEPNGIDPLYDAIDADELDGLLQSTGTGVLVSFRFEGCEVVVTNEGQICLFEGEPTLPA